MSDRKKPGPDFSSPIWIHAPEFAGESPESKLRRVRNRMRETGIASVALGKEERDDIAWLTDLRGNAEPDTPVFESRMFISRDKAVLFVNRDDIDDEVNEHLTVNGISVAGIGMWEDFLKDAGECSSDTVTYIKCVKTPEELLHMRESHVRDGVYVSKCIAGIKMMLAAGEKIDELACVKMMHDIRSKDDRFICESFPTIAGCGPHGAIIHYEPDEKTNTVLKPEGLMVFDTGAQYIDGTTDVTRTIVLGPVTEEEKTHYTCVLQGMLRVMNARFRGGKPTKELDDIARAPIKGMNPDWNYKHGTGHGVGYCLQVHEKPVRITEAAFEPGMVFSDEPGIYIEGSHGVRIENVIECKNADGGYLTFGSLTWVPLESSAVRWDLMTDEDRKLYDDYMTETYEHIGEYLTEDERNILFN